MFLSRNLDQNMLENVLFFGKGWNNRRSVWGGTPKPPLASGGWGLCPQTPELLPSSPVTVTFLSLLVAVSFVLSKNNKST